MISFVAKSLWLSVRMFPNVVLLYIILSGFFFAVYIFSNSQITAIYWVFFFLGWFLSLVMQIALIREGLRKLDATEDPELDDYMRAILNAGILSTVQGLLGIVLSLLCFDLLFKATGLTQAYIDSFGYDYIIDKIIADQLVIKMGALLSLIVLGYAVLRTTVAAFLTVPLAAQAALAGDGKRRGLFYGAAMKFYKIGVTWVIGNIILLGSLVVLFISLNFAIVGEIMEHTPQYPVGSAEGFEEAVLYYAEILSSQALSTFEIYALLGAIVLMLMWWTSMWAASAALGFAEYEHENQHRNKSYVDALRYDHHGQVDAKELWKSRGP